MSNFSTLGKKISHNFNFYTTIGSRHQYSHSDTVIFDPSELDDKQLSKDISLEPNHNEGLILCDLNCNPSSIANIEDDESIAEEESNKSNFGCFDEDIKVVVAQSYKEDAARRFESMLSYLKDPEMDL